MFFGTFSEQGQSSEVALAEQKEDTLIAHDKKIATVAQGAVPPVVRICARALFRSLRQLKRDIGIA